MRQRAEAGSLKPVDACPFEHVRLQSFLAIPEKAGIQPASEPLAVLDSRFRGNDGISTGSG
jgi:hypothetical protein